MFAKQVDGQEWHGLYGHCDPQKDQNPEEAARRQIKAELGVTPKILALMGVIDFVISFQGKSYPDLRVYIYFCPSWMGKIPPKKEKQGRWVEASEVPVERIAVQNKKWLPRVLRGEKIKGDYTFDTEKQKNRFALHRLT
jgi:8-oxo-dGTP diphosphatase